MTRILQLSPNKLALLFCLSFGAMLAGCVSVNVSPNCKDCGSCGGPGEEACAYHTPPNSADTTKFTCTQGKVCDPGGTCLAGMTCKTTTYVQNGITYCACGCKL
jgi:hypothetical protein